MRESVAFGIRQFARAAGMAAVLIFAVPALGTASAESLAGVKVAQETTPLRMLGPQAQQCIASCESRAQECYHHARTDAAREGCEHFGSSCRRGC
jgi:hypothetical protein